MKKRIKTLCESMTIMLFGFLLMFIAPLFGDKNVFILIALPGFIIILIGSRWSEILEG